MQGEMESLVINYNQRDLERKDGRKKHKYYLITAALIWGRKYPNHSFRCDLLNCRLKIKRVDFVSRDIPSTVDSLRKKKSSFISDFFRLLFCYLSPSNSDSSHIYLMLFLCLLLFFN